MGLTAKEVAVSSQAASSLESLECSNDRKAIARKARVLRRILLADCLHGEVVKQRFIPAVLQERHGVQNLYVEDLPDFWRLLYTIAHEGHERYVVVVEIVDHKTYDRWFPGRGR